MDDSFEYFWKEKVIRGKGLRGAGSRFSSGHLFERVESLQSAMALVLATKKSQCEVICGFFGVVKISQNGPLISRNNLDI